MRKLSLIFFSFALLVLPNFAHAQMNIGGRVVATNSADGKSIYQFSWPAIYFEQNYSGRCIDFSFGESNSSYKIYLNGEFIRPIKPEKSKIYSICSNRPRDNSIRIEKISETQGNINSFNGFKASNGILGRTPKREIAMEFIGDSLSVGYGNTSQTRNCNGADVAKTTDSSLAYPVLTAKAFNSEYQINASSGFGIVRNYNNADQGRSLLVLYQSTQIKEHIKYIDNSWVPDVYFIGLGTNDFSTNIGKNEKWQSAEELEEDFVATYVWFLKTLRAKSPNAAIVLISNGRNNPKIASAIDSIEARLQHEKLENIQRFDLPNLEFLGCNYHPNLKEHKQISDELILFIKDNKIIKAEEN